MDGQLLRKANRNSYVCDLSNGAISDDLERTVTVFSRSHHADAKYLTNGYRDGHHTLECCKGDDASQRRSPKFDPRPHSNPVRGNHSKLTEVITSWTPTLVQKFVTICPGVSFPRMRDFARQIAHQKVLVCLWFLQLATAKAPGQILGQNTPKLAIRGREHKI